MATTEAGWSNWSGSVSAPARVVRPTNEAALSALVRDAVKVRAVGAGHSFRPLCRSDELIVSLDAMAGDLSIAPDRKTARIPAGWSIKRLTEALWQHGLAPVSYTHLDVYKRQASAWEEGMASLIRHQPVTG